MVCLITDNAASTVDGYQDALHCRCQLHLSLNDADCLDQQPLWQAQNPGRFCLCETHAALEAVPQQQSTIVAASVFHSSNAPAQITPECDHSSLAGHCCCQQQLAVVQQWLKHIFHAQVQRVTQLTFEQEGQNGFGLISS